MSPVRPRLARRKTRVLLLPVLLGLAAFGSAQAATTYYVRADGGDASQCTGRADARYPGSGTGQACAWKHPFFALAPNGTRRIAGGDTLLIGSGTYTIGQGAPGAGSCSGASCDMPPIPSGPTATARTRFLGKSASAPPKFLGTNGVKILNLEGSSNVEVGNLEITDQHDCVYKHSNTAAACGSSGNWAKTGLSASASANVWLHDINIHGMAAQGVLAGGLNNWTIERVRLIANGRIGWGGNIGSTGSSNSGAIVMREVEIAWNGCGERWQTGAPWACWAQQTGGYGDGVGTTYTGGQWLIEDSFIHHNTSDGLDLRYMDGADDTHVTVRRLHAVGNAGNQVKIRGNSVIDNSVIISNCGYFQGKHFMLEADNCRANGNSLQLVMTANDNVSVRHNTITGEGGVLIGAGEGDSTGRIWIQNNLLVGFPVFTNPGALSAVFYGNSPAAVSFSGNLVWNVKNNACPSGSICGQNPRLTNMSLDGFDAELLSGSPAIDKVALLSGVSSDFVLQPRPSGSASDIGAYELQVGGSTPLPEPDPEPEPEPEPTPVCTRATPTVTLAGPATAVSAGATNSYNLALRNNDSSACSNTTFSLARSVPGGWTGTLSATSVALAPGAGANATVLVTSPVTATAGTYNIGAGAGSSAGSIHTASATADYVVKNVEVVGTLTQSISTSKSTYRRGETVAMSARVLVDGQPAAGATVRFDVIMPTGNATIAAIADSNGMARGSLALSRGMNSVGSYTLVVEASSGSRSVTSRAAFQVLK